MENFIKEETKNLDIYNLSKDEIKNIIIELFRYYGETEILPLYRGSGNHVRLYPGLGIEKHFSVGKGVQPFDRKKVLEDIQKMTDDEKIKLHNIYRDEECIIRNLDMKAYLFDFMYSGDLYFIEELLFLKLFKNGFINIRLFGFKHDIQTNKGKDFYAYMDKYIIKSDEFHSNETGKTEFDIKKIAEESYKDFINYILENIILKGDESDEYETSNRLDFIATIPSIKIFFEKLHSMLSKYYEDNIYLKEEFIKLLNESDNNIKITFSEYFKEKVQFFEYFKYLESKNILTINKIYQEKSFLGPIHIVFNIEKHISKFNTIQLVNYRKEKQEENVRYINNKLFIYGKQIKFNKGSKIGTLYKLVFDYFKENETNIISFENLTKYYELNKGDYPFEKNPIFQYGYFRRDIEIKNESLEIKNFLGINYKGIECRYFDPEIN